MLLKMDVNILYPAVFNIWKSDTHHLSDAVWWPHLPRLDWELPLQETPQAGGLASVLYKQYD